MPTTTTTTRSTEGGRTVAALMLFAGLFSLVGKTTGQSNPAVSNPAGVALSDGQIILGTGAATVVLTLVSHAGEPGRQLAVGLALVVLASSAFVFGAPVWDLLSRALGVGHGPTTPTAPSAAENPTTPTTPTGATTA